MTLSKQTLFRHSKQVLVLLMLIVASMVVSGARGENVSDGMRQVLIPQVDPERGKKLFGDKACVVCHAINGVGGDVAPALDAKDGDSAIALMEFAARMWRGADVMLILQAMELGYQIDLSGQEIGDIAAFVYDRESQKSYTVEDVPDIVRKWFLIEPMEFQRE